MVDAHTGVNKSGVELVTKLKVTPEDNPTSQALKAGGDKNVANAEGAEGRGVRQGLHRPRGRLPPAGARRGRQDADPGAKNEELKALLVKVRPAFVAHLEHAKHPATCRPLL